MEPLLRMDNVESILFPQGPEASGEADLARASERLGNELVAGLEAITGRRLAESERARNRRLRRPIDIDADPLTPVERDPTWFIRKFDSEREAESIRERLLRRAEGQRRRLCHGVRLISDRKASHGAEVASELTLGDDTTTGRPGVENAVDLASAPELAPARNPCVQPIESMTLVGRFRRYLQDASADQLARLGSMIDGIRDRETRRILRRMIRGYMRLRSRIAGLPPAPPYGTKAALRAVPARAAGGKTDRYTPLD